MKKSLLLVSVVLITLYIEAQENYLPGKVVNNLDDTVSGYINYQEWNENPNTILFKKTIPEAPIEYNVFGIKAFIVAKDIYISKEVAVNMSAENYEELNDLSNPKMKSKDYFYSCR